MGDFYLAQTADVFPEGVCFDISLEWGNGGWPLAPSPFWED